MTVPIHLHVAGLAGTVTLTVQQPHGDHVHQLLSLMLDPPAVQDLISRLQNVSRPDPSSMLPTPDTTSLQPVRVHKTPRGLWTFTCPHHPADPYQRAFYTAGHAIRAAHKHATRHVQGVRP